MSDEDAITVTDKLIAQAVARRMGWQPIETAPKDGSKVDLWAKCWLSKSDGFAYMRFTDCYWTRGDAITGRAPHWVELGDGWYPTHWSEPLPPPNARLTDQEEGQ